MNKRTTEQTGIENKERFLVFCVFVFLCDHDRTCWLAEVTPNNKKHEGLGRDLSTLSESKKKKKMTESGAELFGWYAVVVHSYSCSSLSCGTPGAVLYG